MASINVDKMAQDAIDLISATIKNLNRLNIIVAGKTGVGKSTLINSVFRQKLTKTGMGKPVTDHMRRYTKKGLPLAVYDTRGFELGKNVQAEVKKEIIDTIAKGNQTHDINEVIHCIWYCINTTSNRVEPEEIKWIKELSREDQVNQVPIIIVLTQSISKKNAETLRKHLLDENLDVVQIVPVLAADYQIDDDITVKSYGLDTLIHVMGQALPEELLTTLQNVQIASLTEKRKQAQAAIATAAVAAAGVAASPIPFSDSALLVPTQLGMIAGITAIYGLDVNKSILTAFLSTTLGAGGATVLGKTIVANLIKMIPGAGSLAGGAISAGTATLLTTALGEAYIGVMELVFKGELSIEDLSTKKGKDAMADLFKYELTKKQ